MRLEETLRHPFGTFKAMIFILKKIFTMHSSAASQSIFMINNGFEKGSGKTRTHMGIQLLYVNIVAKKKKKASNKVKLFVLASKDYNT